MSSSASSPLNSDEEYEYVEIEVEEEEEEFEEIEIEEEELEENDELNKIDEENRNNEIEEEFEEVDAEEELDDRIGNELTPSNKENRSNEMGDEEVDEEELEQVEIEDGVNVSRQIGEKVEEELENQIGNELIPLDEENNNNDTNQILETKEHEKLMQSDLVTLDTRVSKALDHILTRHGSVGGFKAPEPVENESVPKPFEKSSQVKGENTSGEIGTKNNVLKADLEENGEVNDMRSETLIQDNDVALTTDNASIGKDNDETNPSAVEVEDEDMQTLPTGVVEDVEISPRLYVPRIRTRDSSTSAELDGANKRQKIKACEFYAKGWCIKGVWCRFPHVKEGLDATMKKSEDRSVIAGHGKASTSTTGVLNDRRSHDLSFYHPKQTSSFHLPSWNTNNYGSHKPFESNLGASPFSYREFGSYSRNHIFKDPNDYKSSTSFNDWEPSVPFRPSHQITINLLSKDGIYDPLRDIIAQNKVRDELENASNFVEGSSMMNVNMQSNNSEHENKVLTSVSMNDDHGLTPGKQRDRTEEKVDESHKDNKTYTDSKKEGHVKNEENALKQFQAALIEHVKELIKPTWQEGLMSRDAHKLIVKKSMDKVLSSLQHEQVPSTSEQIKSYLSRSQSKLAKLVEAYIEKHGKS